MSRIELSPPVVSGDVTITSAIGSITWTATDGGIAPGEFDAFVVQLGPIPDAAELVLPTLQGYSDGTTVDWSEVAVGDAEPEHPAPVLEIGPAAPEAATDHDHATSPSVEMEAATPPPTGSAADDGGTTAFGITGLDIGVVGLVIAVIAIVAESRAGRRG